MNDSEWALIAPLIPPARRGGRPRDVNLREALNAIAVAECQYADNSCLCMAYPSGGSHTVEGTVLVLGHVELGLPNVLPIMLLRSNRRTIFIHSDKHEQPIDDADVDLTIAFLGGLGNPQTW
jgi:hypothetical protein